MRCHGWIILYFRSGVIDGRGLSEVFVFIRRVFELKEGWRNVNVSVYRVIIYTTGWPKKSTPL